jgi:ferredoxin
MRVVVNLTRCQGYAQCAFLAPDVFRMRGDEVLMYDPEPDDAQRERVLRAVAACVLDALALTRESCAWQRTVDITTTGARTGLPRRTGVGPRAGSLYG